MALTPATTTHAHWSSRLTFLLASIGFAVGLGNIWRFPYIVGENGGSAFIIVYLICAFAIGVPLVMAEWAIGRRGQRSTIESLHAVAEESGAPAAWRIVGGIALVAVFMIMLFYTVIAGWTLDYFARAITGAFQGITAEGSQAMFESLLADPMRLILWHSVVIGLIVYINAHGLHRGIERAVNILMPALFLFIVAMVIYGAAVGEFGQAAKFLLAPDFSRLTPQAFLIALGQAFFSIGIAMAVMITYGAYLSKESSIPQNALIVVGADTGIALLAGFAIFPLVFAHGLAPDTGSGLVFQTLPIAFGALPGGQVFASLFFLLLIAAALTSSIANFEPVLVWLEERFGWSRIRAALAGGVAMWGLGLASVLSFNVWSGVYPLDFIPLLEGMTFYELAEFISSTLLLPLGGLLTAIFVGWVASSDVLGSELGLSTDSRSFRLWRMLVRYLAPLAIGIVFVSSLTG